MQIGFLLDQTKCIGCHACTVACKSENDVPLGVFRTWVKYVETGSFPDTSRHFAVMRCNQCTRAPCVSICPTKALHKRPDGIVDLDRDVCVGCRACMEACPYDALHFDDGRGVASKCHFCAHRVEQGRAPACAVVCPTQAIQVMDLHDPNDPITQRVRAGETAVRRPEMKTSPNVHYVGASPLALEPNAAVRLDAWIWSERAEGRDEVVGVGPSGAQVVMEPVHMVPWGWHVTTFILLKGIEAGFAALAPFTSLAGWIAPLVATVGTALVAFLMVHDLGRPERFYMLLTRGNPGSWLVRGAWLLTGYGLVQGVALLAELAGRSDIGHPLALVGAALAPAVAGYSAFLFAQCEGRELWRSKLVLPRLLAQGLAGGGALAVALGASSMLVPAAVGFVAYVALALAFRRGEGLPAHFLRTARPWGLHPLGALAVGGVSLLAATAFPPVAALVWAALYVEDAAWIRAGQLPPNS